MEISDNDAIYNIIVNSCHGSKEIFRELIGNLLNSIYSRTDDQNIIQEFQARMLSRAKKYIESQRWDVNEVFKPYIVVDYREYINEEVKKVNEEV